MSTVIPDTNQIYNAFGAPAAPAPTPAPTATGQQFDLNQTKYNANLGPDANHTWVDVPHFVGTACRTSNDTQKTKLGQEIPMIGIVFWNQQGQKTSIRQGGNRIELSTAAHAFGLYKDSHHAWLCSGDLEKIKHASIHLRMLILDHIADYNPVTDAVTNAKPITLCKVPNKQGYTTKDGKPLMDFASLTIGTQPQAAPMQQGVQGMDFSMFN